MCDDEEQLIEEPLDPRVQYELEKLNKASLLINKLENDIDNAKRKFHQHLSDSSASLEALSKKLGTSIDRAKPYYDARIKAKEVQVLSQQAAARFERAISMQNAAREMVELAEQGYEKKSKPKFDTAWQEMLNHATIKVMDAERERLVAEMEHQKTASSYAEVQESVNRHYKAHKRSIARSKIYYEMKSSFHNSLEQQKGEIDNLQQDIDSSKRLYSKALQNLELISEEIHELRKQNSVRKRLGERGSGVGSESPVPFEETCNKSQPCDHETISNLQVVYNPELAEHYQTRDDLNSPTNNSSVNELTIVLSGTNIDEPSDNMGDTTIISCQDPNELTIDTDAPRICSVSPVVMRHRRTPSAIQLSVKRLMEEHDDSGSEDSGISEVVVLDDESVETAMSGKFFNGNIGAEITIPQTTSTDYLTLPANLQKFQRPYEHTRKSVSEADLKLDQVLKLLEEVQDESVV